MRLWIPFLLPLLFLMPPPPLAAQAFDELPQSAFGQRVAALEQRAHALARGHGAGRTDPVYRTNHPLALLALKKVQTAHAGPFGPPAGSPILEGFVAEGEAALDRLEQGLRAPALPGVLNELAYVTENDRTVQPYHLYLPPDYDPTKQWPLIVFLHGYVPTINVLDPWLLPDNICAIAGRLGCMLLIPYGRRNTDFQGVGEVDVFAAMNEVIDLFPTDTDRLYLSGVSMGGMGAWNIGLRHPGVFAAVTPICGQTDMFIWWGWPREQAPLHKRWLVEWDNAVDQALNLHNQNFFVQHGERDHLISAEQSRLMVTRSQELGVSLEYYEFPGASHYIYWDSPCYENAWEWSVQHRLDRSPREVRFKTYSLEYPTAFWLTIEQFDRWGIPAEVSAAISENGSRLDITAANIRVLRINTQTAPLVAEGLEVTVNGRQRRHYMTENGDIEVRIRRPWESAGWPPVKRKGLCGPCEEVFDTRFIVVQGTLGDAFEKEELALKTARWADEWDRFADGRPIVMTDVGLTEEEIQSANLVLFGTPETNAILAQIADRLPIGIGDRRYVIGDREFAGEDLGLVMCYPNPLAPDRYVLIYSGEWYGERLSINHKHDLLPDFIVFTTERFGRDDANEALCAGFFDMDWQLSPRLTWTPPVAHE